MQECLECGSRLRETDGFCPGCGLRIHKFSSFPDHEDSWDDENEEYENDEDYEDDNWTHGGGWRDKERRDGRRSEPPSGRRDEYDEWHLERKSRYDDEEEDRHRERDREHSDEEEERHERRRWMEDEEHSWKTDRSEPGGQKTCPKCDSHLVYVEEYGELWCDECEKYPLVKPRSRDLDREMDGKSERRHERSIPDAEVDRRRKSKSCPGCNGPLVKVEEYGELWCDECEKYPLVERRKSEKEDRKKRCEETQELKPLPKIPDPDEVREHMKDEKRCPHCGTGLILAEEFGELWCDKCNKYPFVKRRPPDREKPPADLPKGVEELPKRRPRPKKSKGFERLITISIVFMAVFAALFAYQDIVLKEKAKQQHLSGQESIIRREAFTMISGDEVGMMFEFIRQAQLYENMSDEYFTKASNLFRYGQYGTPLYNDYFNKSMDYFNAALVSKGSFIQMMEMTYGYLYTDTDTEVPICHFHHLNEGNDIWVPVHGYGYRGEFPVSGEGFLRARGQL